MNYLSHFVYNHDVCGLPERPYFAMGVVLPDLWLRFSRKQRIRWKAVRTAEPGDATDADLRDGLLNHAEMDRRFHTLPLFLRWQRHVERAVDGDDVHPAVLDFLAHMAVELVLDHRLLRTVPRLADRFYDVVERCDVELVARRAGVIGAVQTDGLAGVIAGFLRRRFLRQYDTPVGLVDVMQRVLHYAGIPRPHESLLFDLVDQSDRVCDPAAAWHALGKLAPAGPPGAGA